MSELLREEESALDIGSLRQAVQEEYAEVAANPKKGFHFHTGRSLARMLEYQDEWLDGIPESSIESFAGTGNSFSLGELGPSERVVDVGSGAGIDSLIPAKKVGPDSRVIGVDMTPSMLEKACHAPKEAKLENVEFREGYAEVLPVPDSWADVAISNGVLNLMSDKACPRRDVQGAKAGRSATDRGHSGAESLAGSCQTQDRSLDRVNSRGSAGSRARGHGRGRRFR